MQSKGISLRIMILGQSGTGKSTLGNLLLGLNTHSGERFAQRNDANGRKAFASQYLHATVAGIHLHVIDTPGLFRENFTTTATANWSDIVHAFEISEHKVDAFLLVLNAKDPEVSKRVAEAFEDFFGLEGATRSVVVFTNNDHPFRSNSTRIVKSQHFDYLKKYLKEDFPVHYWRSDINARKQLDEIIQSIKDTAECHQYVEKSFTEAQFQFCKKYLHLLKTKGDDTRAESLEELANVGIPHYLLVRFFSPKQKAELLGVANSSATKG